MVNGLHTLAIHFSQVLSPHESNAIDLRAMRRGEFDVVLERVHVPAVEIMEQ